MLNIIETLIKRGITPEHENWPVYLAETMLAGYNGRMAFKQPSYKYIADNDPVLHNRNHIEELSDLIERSAVSKEPWPQLAGGETTHLTVMDDNKNTVCITQSVNMVYGSKTAADGLGFLYNNYLIDCWPFPLDHPFGLNPGGTAPSSVAPFIVMHQGKPWLAAGSPGSQRIVSALTQFLVHVLHEGMSISKAMTMPRMHCQKKGIIAVEQGGFPEEVINSLKRRDYNIEEKPAFYFGAIHATLAKRASSVFQGVAEMRRDGTAKGPK